MARTLVPQGRHASWRMSESEGLHLDILSYRWNLPHWHPEGKILFVTWRLAGSLPAEFIRESRCNAEIRTFRSVDAALDRAESGPLWLKDHRIASYVVDSLQHGEAVFDEYRLHAYVVMPNHVHVLLEPHTNLRRITQGIKGTTSRRANAILQRTGQPFWQDESFDRWMRDEDEFLRVRHYIVQNPVAAGLVKVPEDWRWSSARDLAKHAEPSGTAS